MYDINCFEKISRLLSPSHAHQLSQVGIAEEVRLSVGKLPCVITGDAEIWLEGIFTYEDMLSAIEAATCASMRTAASRIIDGYIPYNGLRIGVCGTGSYDGNKLCAIHEISSLAIRIPHECTGICAEHIDAVRRKNTLIISSPGGGKTTALREIIRVLSDNGIRIGLADERGEIAAMTNGVAQFDVGLRTDVISGVEISRAAVMLLRGMAPQVIAMDEITKPEDVSSVIGIVGCGVGIIATAHAASTGDLTKRPVYRQLIEASVFERVIVITGRGSERQYNMEILT